MNGKVLVYSLGQFLLSLAVLGAACVTARDWVVAVCSAAGNALVTGLAKADNSGGRGPLDRPPAP